MSTITNQGTQGAITDSQVNDYRSAFDHQPNARMIQNAITNGELIEVALNREVVNNTDFSFSTTLDEWEVTNQKQSGRCWIFAALNLLRPPQTSPKPTAVVYANWPRCSLPCSHLLSPDLT